MTRRIDRTTQKVGDRYHVWHTPKLWAAVEGEPVIEVELETLRHLDGVCWFDDAFPATLRNVVERVGQGSALTHTAPPGGVDAINGRPASPRPAVCQAEGLTYDVQLFHAKHSRPLMASATDLIEPLAALARKCIDRRSFGYAENFCNLLVALESGRWPQLPDDEQALWLDRLASLLHVRALGDSSWALTDPDYLRACDLTDALLRAKSKTR